MERVTQFARADNAGRHSVSDDRVTLDYDHRNRRRITLTTHSGRVLLLDLERPSDLQAGDLLLLDSGEAIRVEAAPEDLLEITANDHHHLVRLAWHLGNRHLPTEIDGERLYIRADHVIAEMVTGLGGVAQAVHRAFNPEGGAYGHGRTHGHSHD